MALLTFDLAHIGAGLPVAAHAAAITEALTSGAAVIEAPPGTGKTTFVPPLVANRCAGRVIVTQPRRVAARAAAARLASLTGTRVGDLIGHVVRGDARVSDATRVEFCTTGVLIRRLLHDPELSGVDAVILDEVHERHLADDLALGMLAELRELRPDLTVVAMSATLDARMIADTLASAPIVQVAAEIHPLEVRWAPPVNEPFTARGVTHDFLDHIADQTVHAVADLDPQDSALVFVPGAWEVEQVCARLTGRVERPVLPLHGRLSPTAQDAAIHGRSVSTPDAGMAEPRVVVATAVAESSVTVEGVRLVIDSCVAREPRFDVIRGITGLVTVSVSRASATQRAGRAARLGPGTVVRCMASEAWARCPEAPLPEIRTADLTAAMLDLAVWGTPGGRGMSLPEPVPHEAAARATRTLHALGALEDDGRASPHGRRLASIPVDPRLAHGLLAAVDDGVDVQDAADVTAFLADAGPIPADVEQAFRRVHRERPRTWSSLSRQLREHVHAGDRAPGATALQRVPALAWPDRIGRLREPGSREYLLTGGMGAEAPRAWSDPPEWVAVVDLDRGPHGPRIRAAVPITRDLAERAAHRLRGQEQVASFDVDRGRISGRRVDRLGAIELSSTPQTPDFPAAQRAVQSVVADSGLDAIGWDDAAEGLRRRVAFLAHHLGEPWPSMSLDDLQRTIDTWCAPEIALLADGTRVRDLDLHAALRRSLPWPEAGRLDELAPERFTVPSGSSIRITYPTDPQERPIIAVKLQELFGLTQTPRLVDGRVPVLFHLLSPAQRPLAITDDLASFWSGPYAQVRAENRGKYSKHPWPEDPLTAPPQRGTKRSGR